GRTLKLKQGGFIKITRAQEENPRIYAFAREALQLAGKGVARLAELGYEAQTPKPSIHFIHTITQSQTAASFEEGAKKAGLTLVPFEDVVARQQAKRLMPTLPVRFTFKGKDHDYELTPDIAPFVLVYPNGSYRCVCVETDCASEPLSSS